MKKLLILGVVLALAACGPQQQSTTTEPAPTTPTTETPTPTTPAGARIATVTGVTYTVDFGTGRPQLNVTATGETPTDGFTTPSLVQVGTSLNAGYLELEFLIVPPAADAIVAQVVTAQTATGSFPFPEVVTELQGVRVFGAAGSVEAVVTPTP